MLTRLEQAEILRQVKNLLAGQRRNRTSVLSSRMTECQHRWEEVPAKLIYKCARCGAFMRVIK